MKWDYFLQESFILQSIEERQDYRGRIEWFLNAFNNTSFFDKPSHIHVLQQYVPDWNLYSDSEQITVV